MKNLVNPLMSDVENIEHLVGYINFQEKVIDNLRQQILNLRQMAKDHKMSEHVVDHYQFKHLTDKV